MPSFETRITRLWWIPLITGLLCLGLGVWCLVSPLTSIPFMAYAFAGVLCVAGLFNIWFSVANANIAPNWGWALALGLLEIVAGGWMFCLSPAEAEITFVWIIGIWLLVVSINAICETCMLGGGRSWGWSIFTALLLVATIIFAVFLLSSPMMTIMAGWLYLGISLITFGVYRICVSFKVRSISRII